MKSYSHKIIFTGLVINKEQLEVEISHTYQVIRHPGEQLSRSGNACHA